MTLAKTNYPYPDCLIFDSPQGTNLTCKKDVLMEDDKQKAFTKGHTYVVKSTHLFASPAPRVKLVNDQGEEHFMYGRDVAEYFVDPRNI
jgi:hypothetical protein